MREDIEPLHLVLTLTAGVITELFTIFSIKFDILRKFTKVKKSHNIERSDFFRISHATGSTLFEVKLQLVSSYSTFWDQYLHKYD